MPITNQDLEHRFAFHPADEEKRQRHEQVRAICLEAGIDLVDVTGPPSREQSLAITHLEESMFWANAAIARGDGIET